MITFFTATRAFTGEFDKLQRTAIQSWRTAVPGCEVILFDHDVSDGAGYLSDHPAWVAANGHGTPLVSSIFEHGEYMATNDLLCEISADIILGGDFQFALEAIADIERPFVIGQRLDIDPGAAPETAVLHDPVGIDYFIYRRGTLGDIPPFAVGRTAYDNWLVWEAVERWGLTVIDATKAITAVHVNHGYPGHASKAEFRATEEIGENQRLFRESGASVYGVHHAPYVLNGKVMKR